MYSSLSRTEKLTSDSLFLLFQICPQCTSIVLYRQYYLDFNSRGCRNRDCTHSWIYNYLCNQCLSPQKLWIRTPPRSWRDVLDSTLYDKVWQWLETGRWFSLHTLVSSTIKTDCHDITEILLKVTLNTLTLTLKL